MKVKHLLLGIALVALVAACGKKEAPVETPTETAIETPAEEVVEAPVEAAAPAAVATTPKAKPAPKAQEPKVDPCEKIVSDYESYSLRLSNAFKSKGTGAAAVKEYAALKKESQARDAAVKECSENPTYKKRISQAMIEIKKVL
jgi:hypothetical protein